MSCQDFDKFITPIPDYPQKGFIFYSYLSIYNDQVAFQNLVDRFVEFVKPFNPTAIFSPQPYGVILGSCVANRLGLKLAVAYFNTSLPSDTYKQSFEYEFGPATLEIHRDSLTRDDRVAIIDDVYATGGTMNTCVDLINRFGASTVAIGVFVNLINHKGKQIENYNHKEIPMLRIVNV